MGKENAVLAINASRVRRDPREENYGANNQCEQSKMQCEGSKLRC